MLDNLELTDAHATAIVEKGIEYEVYEGGDEVPSSKKDRTEAAHDIVAFAIDAYTTEGVNPDEADMDDEESATAVAQVQEILEWAGVEIDGEDITFGELPDIEGAEDGDEDDEDGDGDEESETPFDANDIIEDYDSADADDIVELFESGQIEDEDILRIQEYEKENGGRAKILKFEVEGSDTSGDDESGEEAEEPWDGYAESSAKEIKDGFDALAEDDEVSPELAAGIIAFEQAQDKPKASVIKHVEKWAEANDVDLSGEDESGDDEGDEDTEGAASEAPIEGYDEAKLPDLKSAIENAAEEGDLDADTVQEIIAYEEANKNRKTFVKWLNELLESGDDDGEGDEGDEPVEEPESKPAKKTAKKSKAATEDVDLDDDEIEAMLPSGLAQLHGKSAVSAARQEIEERGLTLPGAYEGEEPQLPNDISTFDHAGLSDLLAQFQNAHSTAITEAATATIWSNTYGEIAEYVENQAILDSDQSNEQKRKAEARTDGRVVFFRAKATHFKNRAKRWHELAASLHGKAAVVSRVGGFVGDDNAQSDLRASKPSTRGKAAGATAKVKDTEDDKPKASKPAAKKTAKAKPAPKAKPKPSLKKK